MICTDKQGEQIPSLPPRAVALWPFACAPSALYLSGSVSSNFDPGRFGCLGRHMEACINPKITCCGFQPVSLSATHARHAAVVCARAELRGKFPRSGCLRGKRWQIHDGLSRWGWTGGNEDCGSDQRLMYLRVTLHGFSNMSLKGAVSATKPPATLNADPK